MSCSFISAAVRSAPNQTMPPLPAQCSKLLSFFPLSCGGDQLAVFRFQFCPGGQLAATLRFEFDGFMRTSMRLFKPAFALQYRNRFSEQKALRFEKKKRAFAA